MSHLDLLGILSVPYSGYFSASSENCEIPGSVPKLGFA